MARPTAVPRMPASASGVSTQRSGPKRSRSPAVARKTPPARPTSSPMTITVLSRSISPWRASLTASMSVLLGIGVLGDEVGVRVGQRFGGGDTRAHRFESLRAGCFGELVVDHADPAEVALVTAEALVFPLALDAVGVDVRARVVGRCVWGATVGDRLDEGRTLSGTGAHEGFSGRFVHGEHVTAVHPYPGYPVADGLVRQRLGPGLSRERSGNRPVVVVAEQHDRGLHDRGEVGPFVKGALRGGAVAEEGERASVLAAQALAPREADGVRHMGRNRDSDRSKPVFTRIPPAGGMTAPPGEHGLDGHASQQPDGGLAVRRKDPVLVG